MSRPVHPHHPSRRDVLKTGGKMVGTLVLSSLVIDLAQDQKAYAYSQEDERTEALAQGDVLLGLYPRSQYASGDIAVAQACKQLDWSWLKAGDSVLIKVQSNSPNAHPATTSPAAVRQMVLELKSRGAGRVIVADQAGVQFVRLAEGNKRYGSTRDVFASNGLLAAATSAGAELYFFDEQDFETGYFAGTPTFSSSHWGYPIYVPNIIKQVQHIVYLPRISSHMIAGYTHGHKTAIGWLRDDSRYHLHHDAESIFEKYVEINYVQEIVSRHRLTLTLAEAFMLDQGPDVGTVAMADPRVVIASSQMANHDALATPILTYIDDITPPDPTVKQPYGPRANRYNYALVQGISRVSGIPWQYDDGVARYTSFEPHDYQAGLEEDRALTRAFNILGGVPASIRVKTDGAAPSSDLKTAMDTWVGGLFVWS